MIIAPALISHEAQVEPNNKDVRALKQRYRKEAATANAKDKAMYQRAFQKLAQMRDPEPEPEPKPSAKAEPQSHPIEDGVVPLESTCACGLQAR